MRRLLLKTRAHPLLKTGAHLLPRAYSSPTPRPSPPKLPPDQQAEFERLQREASLPSSPAPGNWLPGQETSSAGENSNMTAAEQPEAEQPEHPALVRGAPPEFAGDKNPRTGEVGGPKREPLRWGATGDWSYNGRVTDF